MLYQLSYTPKPEPDEERRPPANAECAGPRGFGAHGLGRSAGVYQRRPSRATGSHEPSVSRRRYRCRIAAPVRADIRLATIER